MSDLNPRLVKTIQDCLTWAYNWKPSSERPTFEASHSPHFKRFRYLLDRGARITPDTPFSGGTGMLDNVSWDSYCIWNDDNSSYEAAGQFDKMFYAVLVELVKRGFKFPHGEEDLAEFRRSEGFHIEELVALVAKNEADRLEQTLPASTAPPSRPRM